ncbi:hypothetical protein NMY22_g165 [Coprinellus aureogranulatus]|nr:hypothetical protein NMY22_g165 [Coprinellus aureogranulatus]
MSEMLFQVRKMTIYRIHACLNARAAWRRLPAELWDSIFQFYLCAIRCNMRDQDIRDINRLAMAAPNTLSRVSKSWRAAVLATPSVWRDITLPVEKGLLDGVPCFRAGNMRHILSLFDRLVKSPLSLCLSIQAVGSWSHCDADEDIPPIDGVPIPLVLQHHPAVSSVSFLSILGPLGSMNLSSLTFLSATSVMINSSPHPRATSPISVPQLPNVRKATLVDFVDGDQFPQTFPWAQLTHLFLRSDILRTHQVQGILLLCTSLRQACFGMDGEINVATTPTWSLPLTSSQTLFDLKDLAIVLGSMKHPHVRRRITYSLDPTVSLDISSGIRGLSAPSLTRLRLYFGADVEITVPQLHNYAGLTHLSLVGIAPEQQRYDVGSILDNCPLLIELCVPAPVGKLSKVFQSLTYTPDGCRGRHLQVIALILVGHVYAVEAQVRSSRTPIHDFTASRRPAHRATPTPLQQLIFRVTAIESEPDTHSPVHTAGSGSVILLKTVKDLLRSMQEVLSRSLNAYIQEGLKLCVEDMDDPELNPFPSAGDMQHWDHGVMEFFDRKWEHMPPADTS